MPRAKKTRSVKTAPISKKDFVLSQPAELSAADVVAAGAKHGIELTSKHVYVVRSAAKHSRKPGGSKTGKKPGRTTVSPPRRVTPAKEASPAHEARFFEVVMELGLTRSRELLDDAAARLRAIVQRG